MQVDLCRHIKTNGLQCRAIALKDNTVCYFHARLHGAHARYRKFLASDPPRAYGNLISLPPVEDREAVQIAISKVVSGLSLGLIEERRAAILLYGLQLASSNARGLRIGHRPSQVVREVLCDPELGAASPHFAPAGRTLEIDESAAALDLPASAQLPTQSTIRSEEPAATAALPSTPELSLCASAAESHPSPSTPRTCAPPPRYNQQNPDAHPTHLEPRTSHPEPIKNDHHPNP